MDVLQAIEERRSTRAFLDKPVERKTVETLLSLATRAPSAINLQPWEFVVVSGIEKKRLSSLLVKRMKERKISCGPGAKKPLPEQFVERQRGLLRNILPHLPSDANFELFINEGSCNFYGAPTAIILTLDNAFSSARLTDIGIVVGYLVLITHAMDWRPAPSGSSLLLMTRSRRNSTFGQAGGHRDRCRLQNDTSPVNKLDPRFPSATCQVEE
jgi:nitroreductase